MRVVAAISIVDQQVLCCRRSFGKSHGGLWEFPGGKIEPDETDQQALIREIDEELSQEITVLDLFDKTEIQTESTQLELSAYLVDGISTSVTKGNSHSEIRWLRVEELNMLNWAPADIPIVEKLIKEYLRPEG